MIFNGENNQSIAMSFSGYQFPEIKEVKSKDANWLKVQIKVNNHFAMWQKTNPALLTSEVEELIIWLYNLANKECKIDCLCFTEPTIIFQYMGFRNSKMHLRIHLQSEFRNPKHNKEEDCYMDFALNKEELLSVCFDLEEEVQYYPKR